jgi:hypothetical protein
MRRLNCKRMPQMISLYVAGDLVGPPEREVAAHLAECESCRGLAEEFSGSSSLVSQALTPPEFGAEFYSRIRSTVLGEIKRERMRSKPSLFRRPWVYATAFGIAIIASAFMLHYFDATTSRTPKGSSLAVRPTDQPRSSQANGASSSSPPQLPDMPKSPRKSPRSPGALRVRSDKAFALVNAGTRRSNAPTQTALNESTQISPAMESLTSASASADPTALESAPSTTLPAAHAASPLVARIEIQTSDPNIRIIWLGQRDSHESEGSKNANRK